MSKTTVSIAKGASGLKEKDVADLVREALGGLGELDDLISPGRRVLIKPNVADIWAIRVEVTDLRVVRALARYVREKGAQVMIAEAAAVGMDTEKTFELCRYTDLRHEGFELINLDKTETVKIPLPQAGEKMKAVEVYKLPLDVDTVISVPVLKTHGQMVVTLSLKNLKGCLPDKEKKKFHLKYGVEDAVARLATVVRPHLCVVDGIWAGAGSMGMSRVMEEMNLIVAGRDPVAVDTVCSRIMGIDPQTVLHLGYAQELGVGTMDSEKIEIVGKSVETVKKRFMLPSESMQQLTEDLGFNIISDDRTCTGCNYGIYMSLGVIKQMGETDALNGLTFASGMGLENLPDVPKNRLILVGNCTAKHREKGRHVEGCPIYHNQLVGEITGKEVMAFDDELKYGLDRTYKSYKKKVAEGKWVSFNWDEPPNEKERQYYVT